MDRRCPYRVLGLINPPRTRTQRNNRAIQRQQAERGSFMTAVASEDTACRMPGAFNSSITGRPTEATRAGVQT